MNDTEAKASKKREEESFVWTPTAIKDLEAFVEHLADKYLDYKKNETEADQKYLEASTRHNRNMVFALASFMAVIVLGMSYLSLNNRISGDALLFLIGTITGYVLLFIQRLIFPAGIGEQEETLPA
jgi:uncharacterized membrane protein YjjP (DUF1212 family)